ncbi:MAG: OmpA family protein [Bacteroidales bacterium]|nr:OmpA family protein [Bacteroidales bacterium]
MNIKKLIVLSLSILFTGICSAQAPVVKDADNAFRTCKYEKALQEYKKVTSKIKKNKVESRRVAYQIAECYRIMGDVKHAKKQYESLYKKNYQKDNPLILYHLGNICINDGDYDAALKYYQEFKKRAPEDTRADVMIESCARAKAWKETPTRYEVYPMKKLNTRYDEWAPRWGNPDRKTQIIFTSNRDGSNGKGTDQWTGQAFSDIYVSELPKSRNTEWPGDWSPVASYDENQVINTVVNEGEACPNQKATAMYYTYCPQDKKEVKGCYIYVTTKKGKDWTEPEKVDLGIDSFNYVHPFVTGDELTLFFASNKPGGYGGYDLYKVTRSKKSKPFAAADVKNLGSVVNTAGNEVFPALRGDSLLYFSSDGHYGLGGLDIYYSEFVNGQYQTPENLLSPINSEADEIGIMFDDAPAIDPKSKSPYVEKGYFSSNRAGGKGGDDIYYFLLRPLVYTIAGFVKDASNLQPIDGATVEIVGSDGTTYKTKTDVKGYYKFDKDKILGNTTYSMVTTRSGYFAENNTASQTTVGLSENTDLKQDFKLTPLPREPIVLPEILYDFDKSDLKPQYEDSLLFVYDIMTQNPTLVVELRSHTDNRGNDEYNERLSQDRAQSCVDYLINVKGVDKNRISPKGYGEYMPRVLTSDMTVTYNKKQYTFKKGTKLTEDYINSLSPKDYQEAAHQLNRRTELYILRDDYVPGGDTIAPVVDAGQINVYSHKSIPVSISKGVVKGACYANNKTFNFEMVPGDTVYMNHTDAMRFLKDHIVSIEDFDAKAAAINEEDGQIIENSILTLKSFNMGDNEAENVKVVVKKGLTSSFLVGEGFLTRTFGNFTVDKAKKVIIFEK